MSVCDERWYTVRHVIPLGAGGRGGGPRETKWDEDRRG